MRTVGLLSLVLVICVENEVFCRMLRGLNNNNVIPNSMAKDYRLQEFYQYLKELADMELLTGVQFKFPRSIVAPNYRLTEGKVERYYDPIKFHGVYKRVLLNTLEDDFFAVLQVFSPKIHLSYRYQTNSGSGSFQFLMTHDALQVTMDLGHVANGVCDIIKNEHEGHYFFSKDKIKFEGVRFSPDSEAGRSLLQEIKNTWLPHLYAVIIKSKVQTLIQNVKKTLIQNPQMFPELKLHCRNVR